jgi:hypothetical protein
MFAEASPWVGCASGDLIPANGNVASTSGVACGACFFVACSVLLKDSFVDSFPPRDRPFMRAFSDTQMFSVYTDSVI